MNDDDHPAEDPAQIELMQDELISLMGAWADRGFTPAESAMYLAGVSHLMLARAGYSLAEFIDLLRQQWEKHDGKP
jgi:hypothetical protein